MFEIFRSSNRITPSNAGQKPPLAGNNRYAKAGKDVRSVSNIPEQQKVFNYNNGKKNPHQISEDIMARVNELDKASKQRENEVSHQAVAII